MKKYLFALLICLLPIKALAFELTFKVDFNGILSNEPDILKIAMNYNGYQALKNRKELKEKLEIDPVSTPWCAGFINYVLDQAGYYSTNSLIASSYHNYGSKVKSPEPGDIVIIRRSGGSGRHVAFFYGFHEENGQKYIQLLGGNQDKAVNITAYPIELVVDVRRPIKKTG